ncbi:methionine ABC transporter permease [Planomonospora venezuelensis]|uniref:D-methionine transport system permease protein n=1 Tax=Planomonospora venezuelensis TaxID=1999 RepID=A0A841D1N5_PLAVE|nr:methionine ABC transporter permease [Planomonospora venezuelensis]MBB5964161.1 D-methionine transport system permease protein [Planomonospora venezuelensis]GIN01844.1 metal ABC transporter permease [Planomonospora venezuelensis]
MTWEEMSPLLWEATGQTAQMVVWSTLFTVLSGLPLGVALVVTDRGGLLPSRPLNAVLGMIVNVGRSLPFIVLMIAVIPLTRLIVGTTIGTFAAVVPLTLGAAPFFARLVETALREVGRDTVQAAQAMGAGRWTIVGKVLLPEARSGLVAGLTVTVVALISYSAMAGVIGGGGLGDLAIRYGYQRFETTLMVVTVIVLIVLVQLVQTLGDAVARRLARR